LLSYLIIIVSGISFKSNKVCTQHIVPSEVTDTEIQQKTR